MKKWMGGLTAWVALAVSGCVLPLDIDIDGDHAIRGSGNLITVTRALPAFEAVSASGAAHIVIERTGAEGVHITAEDNLIPYLEAEVRGGVLYVGPRSGFSLSPRREMVFYVEAYEVVEIQGSGAVSMEADLGWVPELWVMLSGASSLTAWGSADVADISISGASRYDALDLESLDTWIEVSGASTAWVWARRRLDVRASGASHVQFRGNPAIHAEVSGASTVTRY